MLKPVDDDHTSVPVPWHSTVTVEPSSTKRRLVNCVGLLLTVATSLREAVCVCVYVCVCVCVRARACVCVCVCVCVFVVNMGVIFTCQFPRCSLLL